MDRKAHRARCKSAKPGSPLIGCTLSDGHDEEHRNGVHRWHDEPDAATLRALAVNHKLDPRTVAKAIRGEQIKGARTQEAAAAAVAEWKKTQAKKGRAK